MRHRFVVGNWKLNGSESANKALLDTLKTGISPVPGRTCGVCAPFPYLGQLRALLTGSPLIWGAQDVSRFDSGAYTGEVSAAMAADFACRIAIVGHSERRALFGDSDEMVAVKFGRAKQAGLIPILCLGETLAEREAGKTESIVSRQLNAVAAMHGAAALRDALLAYEPVWAIGTGRTAAPDQAEAVHAFLREEVARFDADAARSLPILYGGSVKKSNATELFGQPNIDGGLIGGASLVAEEFLGIWEAL